MRHEGVRQGEDFLKENYDLVPDVTMDALVDCVTSLKEIFNGGRYNFKRFDGNGLDIVRLDRSGEIPLVFVIGESGALYANKSDSRVLIREAQSFMKFACKAIDTAASGSFRVLQFMGDFSALNPKDVEGYTAESVLLSGVPGVDDQGEGELLPAMYQGDKIVWLPKALHHFLNLHPTKSHHAVLLFGNDGKLAKIYCDGMFVEILHNGAGGVDEVRAEVNRAVSAVE